MNLYPCKHYALASILALLPTLASAELKQMAEDDMSDVSAQAGLSIEISQLRINAQKSGSVDDPNTAADESDGRRTRGYKYDWVTKDHNGANEVHMFTDEVSLAVDMEGAWTVDIEDNGALVIGLPDQMNFVGDGYSQKGIYINTDGQTSSGGQLWGEKNIQGNFTTGGTITLWSD